MGSKKREGYSLFIVVILLLLVSIYLTLMFQPLFNITISSKEIEDNIKQTIVDRTGLERVYAQLEENISFRGTLSYDDIGKEYKITTTTQEMREVQLHNRSNFHIYNATNIDINFEHYRLDEEYDSTYDILISHNGRVIKEYSGIGESVVIKIAFDFLYAQKTNTTNYGEYSIELITDNCIVDTMVTYNELDYREISIQDDTIKRAVIAENDMSIGGIKQLYIKDGEK